MGNHFSLISSKRNTWQWQLIDNKEKSVKKEPLYAVSSSKGSWYLIGAITMWDLKIYTVFNNFKNNFLSNIGFI